MLNATKISHFRLIQLKTVFHSKTKTQWPVQTVFL